MQRRENPQVEKAKEELRSYFRDRYGRPLKKPYYVTQLQTLLEGLYYPWIVHQALTRLVEEGFLARLELRQNIMKKLYFSLTRN